MAITSKEQYFYFKNLRKIGINSSMEITCFQTVQHGLASCTICLFSSELQNQNKKGISLDYASTCFQAKVSQHIFLVFLSWKNIVSSSHLNENHSTYTITFWKLSLPDKTYSKPFLIFNTEFSLYLIAGIRTNLCPLKIFEKLFYWGNSRLG